MQHTILQSFYETNVLISNDDHDTSKQNRQKIKTIQKDIKSEKNHFFFFTFSWYSK
jgi:hypothetical protein